MKYLLLICTQIVITTFANAQQILPGLTLVKGDSYHQASKAKMKIYQSIAGTETELTTRVAASVTFTVIDVNDSLYTMKTKYDTLGLTVETLQTFQHFSSAAPNHLFSSLLSAATQHSFTVLIYKTGKIKSVTGITELINTIVNNFAGISADEKEEARLRLTNAYGEAAFKGSFESVTNIFPDRAVKLNEKWEVVTELASLMASTKKTLYHLKEVTDDSFVIYGTSFEKTANKNAYTQVDGTPVRYDFEGGSTSSFTINRKTGWVVKAQINDSILGTANIKASDEIPDGMVIPMKISSELDVTGN
jgi:hypothetical protein